LTIAPGLAAAVILTGNALLSLGNTLQKLNIGWMDKGLAGGNPRGRSLSFLGWLAGFALMNVVPVFQFVALLALPANVVGAAAGANVAFTAIFSRFLLGERLGARKIVLTTVLFAAIAAAGLLGRGTEGDAGFSPIALAAFIVIPLIATVVLLFARARDGRRGLAGRLAPLFAAASGCFGGYMVVTLRALQLNASDAVSAAWLASPYLYAFLLCGFGGFSVVQLAYKDGQMSSIAPALYGMQVLWPALASYFVFGSPFIAAQAAAFALVAACVVAIAGGAPRPAR
jgi:drug/metabolite transporter (DMT)-like permease